MNTASADSPNPPPITTSFPQESDHAAQPERSHDGAQPPPAAPSESQTSGTAHLDVKGETSDQGDESVDEDFHSQFVGSSRASPMPQPSAIRDTLPTPTEAFPQSLTAAMHELHAGSDAPSDVASSSGEGTVKPKKILRVKREKPKSRPSPSSDSDDERKGQGPYVVQGAERYRRLVLTPQKVHFIERPSGNWAFTKCLGTDSDFLAAGQLLVYPRCTKSLSNVKDYTYVFYVIQGTLKVTIHTGSYSLAPGGMFIVPPGNTYSVENTSDTEVKLFFAQARKVPNPDSDRDDEPTSVLIHRLLSVPTSRAGILLALLLQQIAHRYHVYRQTVVYWYRMYLAQYEPQVKALLAGRKSWVLFFLLGYLARRAPVIGSPPVVKVQIIRRQR
ncbi:hypothetical protein AX16_007031 [Volvariella volvacea WC 439]|nr:hypothetical protein AX16_007031 [Volvariella volvacea WC 439]